MSLRVIKDFGVSKCEYTVCAIELTAMRFLDIFIVFARNNLMNIMCKVGDYILKINNIAKSHSLCRLFFLCNNNKCDPTESIKMSLKVSPKKLAQLFIQ